MAFNFTKVNSFNPTHSYGKMDAAVGVAKLYSALPAKTKKNIRNKVTGWLYGDDTDESDNTPEQDSKLAANNQAAYEAQAAAAANGRYATPEADTDTGNSQYDAWLKAKQENEAVNPNNQPENTNKNTDGGQAAHDAAAAAYKAAAIKNHKAIPMGDVGSSEVTPIIAEKKKSEPQKLETNNVNKLLKNDPILRNMVMASKGCNTFYSNPQAYRNADGTFKKEKLKKDLQKTAETLGVSYTRDDIKRLRLYFDASNTAMAETNDDDEKNVNPDVNVSNNETTPLDNSAEINTSGINKNTTEDLQKNSMGADMDNDGKLSDDSKYNSWNDTPTKEGAVGSKTGGDYSFSETNEEANGTDTSNGESPEDKRLKAVLSVMSAPTQRRIERDEFNKADNEHPWLNFFLGPNQDEGWAEDHGIKNKNQLEHGWTLPANQADVIAKARTEQYRKTDADTDRETLINMLKKPTAGGSSAQLIKARGINIRGLAKNFANAYAKDGANSKHFLQSILDIERFRNTIAGDPESRQYLNAMINGVLTDYQIVPKVTKDMTSAIELKGYRRHIIDLIENNTDENGNWYDTDEAQAAKRQVVQDASDVLMRMERLKTGAGAVLNESDMQRIIYSYMSDKTRNKLNDSLQRIINNVIEITSRSSDDSLSKTVRELSNSYVADLEKSGSTTPGADKLTASTRLLKAIYDTIRKTGTNLQQTGGHNELDLSTTLNSLKMEYDSALKDALMKADVDVGMLINDCGNVINQKFYAANTVYQFTRARTFETPKMKKLNRNHVKVSYGDLMPFDNVEVGPDAYTERTTSGTNNYGDY